MNPKETNEVLLRALRELAVALDGDKDEAAAAWRVAYAVNAFFRAKERVRACFDGAAHPFLREKEKEYESAMRDAHWAIEAMIADRSKIPAVRKQIGEIARRVSGLAPREPRAPIAVFDNRRAKPSAIYAIDDMAKSTGWKPGLLALQYKRRELNRKQFEDALKSLTFEFDAHVAWTDKEWKTLRRRKRIGQILDECGMR